jgi:acetyltransferase-like isoleucine patch superfamily enzyme
MKIFHSKFKIYNLKGVNLLMHKLLFNLMVKKHYYKSRKKMSYRYNRVLSFGDLLFDRWEKAKYLKFGEGSSIYDSALVFGDVSVGKNCWIGPFVILDGSGNSLKIGDNCNISAGVQIYTHDTVEKTINNGLTAHSAVLIGNNCYIGPNVVISKNVRIGNNVIIGANSFVNKDIPSRTKAYGNPIQIYPL